MSENDKTTPASTAESKLADLLGKAIAPLSEGIKGIDAKVGNLAERVETLEKGHAETSETDRMHAELDAANANQKALADRLSQDREEQIDPNEVTPEQVFGAYGEKAALGKPNVLPAGHRYKDHKSVVNYPEADVHGKMLLRGGRPVEWRGRQLHEVSEREQHLCGAWFQYHIWKQVRSNSALRGMADELGIVVPHLPGPEGQKEHTMALVKEALHTLEWEWDDGGTVCMPHRGKLPADRIKAMLDDSTSGGENLIPVPIDDAIIRDPILGGEVFPFITVMDLPMGSSIDHGKVGTPTFTWGSNSIEGSAVDLFSTSAFASKITTTIRSVAGAIELGKFFLTDTPLGVFREVQMGYGDRYLNELDRVTVNGNGSTEPIGLFSTSSTNGVTAKNNTAGPLLYSDLERMVFAIPKEYRKNRLDSFRWFGTDATYRRMNQISVGSNDDRRMLTNGQASNYQNYNALGFGYSVENNSNDNDLGLCDLRQYVMVRRNGLSFTVTDQGKELVRKNLLMIVGRARMGGQLHYAKAMAEMNNAPTLN